MQKQVSACPLVLSLPVLAQVYLWYQVSVAGVAAIVSSSSRGGSSGGISRAFTCRDSHQSLAEAAVALVVVVVVVAAVVAVAVVQEW